MALRESNANHGDILSTKQSTKKKRPPAVGPYCHHLHISPTTWSYDEDVGADDEDWENMDHCLLLASPAAAAPLPLDGSGLQHGGSEDAFEGGKDEEDEAKNLPVLFSSTLALTSSSPSNELHIHGKAQTLSVHQHAAALVEDFSSNSISSRREPPPRQAVDGSDKALLVLKKPTRDTERASIFRPRPRAVTRSFDDQDGLPPPKTPSTSGTFPPAPGLAPSSVSTLPHFHGNISWSSSFTSASPSASTSALFLRHDGLSNRECVGMLPSAVPSVQLLASLPVNNHGILRIDQTTGLLLPPSLQQQQPSIDSMGTEQAENSIGDGLGRDILLGEENRVHFATAGNRDMVVDDKKFQHHHDPSHQSFAHSHRHDLYDPSTRLLIPVDHPLSKKLLKHNNKLQDENKKEGGVEAIGSSKPVVKQPQYHQRAAQKQGKRQRKKAKHQKEKLRKNFPLPASLLEAVQPDHNSRKLRTSARPHIPSSSVIGLEHNVKDDEPEAQDNISRDSLIVPSPAPRLQPSLRVERNDPPVQFRPPLQPLRGVGASLQLPSSSPLPAEKNPVEEPLLPKRLEFKKSRPASRQNLNFANAIRVGLNPQAQLDHARSLYPKVNPSLSFAADVKVPDEEPIDGDENDSNRLCLCYNAIKALAKSSKPKSAERAEELLRQMISDFHSRDSTLPPDGGCYNVVLHAYALRGDADKAHDILRLMWEDYYFGNEKAEPNQRIYTTVMAAWQKSRNKEEAPEKCEQLLNEMYDLYDSGDGPKCKPDVYAYTCVLHCWADSQRKDAANRAENLFRTMEGRFLEGDEDLRPDTICYSNLINAYVGCGLQVERAENLFWEMIESDNPTARPTIRSFNTILAAWSKSSNPEAPARVERILRRWQAMINAGRLRESSPDTFSYSLLLKTWANSSRSDAPEKLMEAFRWIQQLYKSGSTAARLDTIKYATVIGALAHVGPPERAHSVLIEMIRDYKNGNDKSKPDAKLFHTVMSAWSRLRYSDKAATEAEVLLRNMWALHEASRDKEGPPSKSKPGNAAPTNWTYNTVIFCYKSSRSFSPQRAENLLREMDKLVNMGLMKQGPDATTYRAVIQAWQKSSLTDKSERIRQLKAEARKRGFQS